MALTAKLSQRFLLRSLFTLPSITRSSVLELAREKLSGETVIIVQYHIMMELEKSLTKGRLVEAFAAGTAVLMHSLRLELVALTTSQSLIVPVSKFHFKRHRSGGANVYGCYWNYAATVKTWLKARNAQDEAAWMGNFSSGKTSTWLKERKGYERYGGAFFYDI